MVTKIETANLLDDLERFAKIRVEVSSGLERLAQILSKAEAEADQHSGKLGLDREIEDLTKVGRSFQQGVFRLLVLGDMKRGKSTFLNALIGENLLPSDVNPCTALLTVLRYGPEKNVTIHFNDGKRPEPIDFKTFKNRYIIDPSEAKQLERQEKRAFPDIDYAVVEYPLPLLERGIEIVDSPGLNDTEARNELSLGYINNCHAILFVLRASQPCTLGERRYLENYIKDRGLTVFFLVNAWDQVKESLIDPDDADELEEAETKLRRVFKANLEDYARADGYDLYDERVFEISALAALRRRVKDPATSLDGTGFPSFMAALNTFLTQERAVVELRQARTLARQIQGNVRAAIERRLPLLEKDLAELRQRISSVEPEFQKLNGIRDEFQQEIRDLGDRKSRHIADSFRTYILNLDRTFEEDFLRYQPDFGFLDFLNSGKRDAFEAGLRDAFERYIQDKLAAWTLTAEKEMDEAFVQLAQRATRYGTSYSQVTDQITEKLTGQTIKVPVGSSSEDNAPGWAKWAAGIFSLARGNIAGVAMASAGFDWKNIMLNFVTVLGLGAMITAISGIVLGPIGLALLGLGVGLVQADQAWKEVVKVTKKELVKYLPQVAREQWQPIYDAVKECFDGYDKEVTERLNDDITSRQAELDNLMEQKESREINQKAEIERLKTLETCVSGEAKAIETIYQHFLAAAG